MWYSYPITKGNQMFALNNPIKLADLSGYVVSSHACPMCGDVATTVVTPQQMFAYNQGAYAQDVLPNLDNGLREQFISGTCPTCWDAMFAFEDVEDEEYIDYYAEASLFGWDS
jgi:predicted RNA-binding Zn-ribbon protein involved in translation (DUF1610 family)